MALFNMRVGPSNFTETVLVDRISDLHDKDKGVSFFFKIIYLVLQYLNIAPII